MKPIFEGARVLQTAQNAAGLKQDIFLDFTRWRCLAALIAAFVCISFDAEAASVGPAGYTNDFSVRPAASDFSTSGGIAGASGDISTAAALDTAVQNVAASSITAQATDSSPANPPVKLAAAQWTSRGSAY